VTTAEKAIAEHQRMVDKRNHLDDMPQKIQELANRFFLQKSSRGQMKPIEDMDLKPPVSSIPIEIRSRIPNSGSAVTDVFDPSSVESVHAPGLSATTETETEAEMEAAPVEIANSTEDGEDEYVPKGSYIDVAV